MNTKTLHNLTPNQLAALKVLLKDCLSNIGGSTPSDLRHDLCTFTSCDVLVDNGWEENAAKGTFGSLCVKDVVHVDCTLDFS